MSYLLVVYTVDHEVVPKLCKIYDWLSNLSWTISVCTKGKKVRATMEFEVPKRHSLRPTLSVNMVQHVLQWERQNRCSNIKKGRQGPMA